MDKTIRFDLDGVSTAEQATLFLREYIDVQYRNAAKETKNAMREDQEVKVRDIKESVVAITGDEESRIVALIQQLFAALPTIERVKLHRQGQELLKEWPDRFAADGVVTRHEKHDTIVLQRIAGELTAAFERSIVK